KADVKVSAGLQRFVEAWRGFRPLHKEITNGHIKLEGSASLCSALPDWLMLCKLADIPRASGREALITNDSEPPAAEPVL
ncbi:MAG: hypothetical protein AAF404_20280, partial [Pseudomonadota bacterium]